MGRLERLLEYLDQAGVSEIVIGVDRPIIIRVDDAFRPVTSMSYGRDLALLEGTVLASMIDAPQSRASVALEVCGRNLLVEVVRDRTNVALRLSIDANAAARVRGRTTEPAPTQVSFRTRSSASTAPPPQSAPTRTSMPPSGFAVTGTGRPTPSDDTARIATPPAGAPVPGTPASQAPPTRPATPSTGIHRITPSTGVPIRRASTSQAPPHPSQRSLVTHKEIGEHVPTFLDAIRSAGRENADVILVGELRGAETMKAALQVASFGILVYASVHTNSAASTIDRYINAFPADQQPQIRGLLADALSGVIAQQLLRRANGPGRVAAHEILFGSIALAGLIREAKPQQIPGLIQGGQAEGMQGMDMTLERLVAAGTVSAHDALDKALDKEAFAKLPIVARQLGLEHRADI